MSVARILKLGFKMVNIVYKLYLKVFFFHYHSERILLIKLQKAKDPFDLFLWSFAIDYKQGDFPVLETNDVPPPRPPPPPNTNL